MTSTRSFTIRRTTAAIPMVEARTIKAMRTGYAPAPTMRGAARTMIRNARTSTSKPWAALTRSLDSAPIISRHIATAFCAGTMKGFGIGRDTSAAALSIPDPDSRSSLLPFSRDRLGRGSLFLCRSRSSGKFAAYPAFSIRNRAESIPAHRDLRRLLFSTLLSEFGMMFANRRTGGSI